MRERKQIGLYILAFVLITIAFTLTFVFDSVHVETKDHKVEDLTHKTANVPNYSFTPIDEFAKAASELFYAAGIALAIYLMIDSRLRKYENNEFSKNIFGAVLKKFIPDELFELLNNDVLGKSVIRKNAILEYVITSTEKGYDMKQLLKFELYNINTKNVTENVTISVAQSDLNRTYFEKVSIEQDGKPAEIYNKSELDAILVPSKNGAMASFPVTLKPKEVACVTLHAMNKYFSKYIVDYHYFSSSCINFEITIHKPSECSVELISSFSQKLVPIFDESVAVDVLQYHPIKGLLPGQTLLYIIEPKKNTNAKLNTTTVDLSENDETSTQKTLS